jgi:tetratricopeptide (TPR) repeat protein
MNKYILGVVYFFYIITTFAQNSAEYIEAGQMMFSNKNYWEALKNFNRAIVTDSTNARGFLLRGQTKVQLALYEEAHKDYDWGLVVNPNESKFYREKGNLFMYQGLYKQAYQAYNTAVLLDAQPFDYLMCAEIQWIIKQKATTKAERKYPYSFIIKDYNKALQKQPKWAIAHRRIGEVLLDSLDNNLVDNILMMQQICQYFQKAAELGDEKAKKLYKDFCGKNESKISMESIIADAEYFFINKDFKKALEMYELVIQNGNFTEEYYRQSILQKAIILAKQNEHQKAVENYTLLLKIIPNTEKKQIANIFYFRSLSFIELNAYQNALIDLSQAIAFGLENGYFYQKRGQIKLKLNQKEEACKDFKIAKQKGQKDVQKDIEKNCK